MSIPVSTVPPLHERLLVVDAHRADLDALSEALAPLGGEVLTATSGHEALALLDRHAVAVILMNVHLPELDGLETATRLKARASTRTIPVLFLTSGDHGLERQLRGYAVGAVDYLAKTVDPEVLRAKVRSIVSWSAELRSLARAHAAYEQSGAALRSATPLSWRRDHHGSERTGAVLSLVDDNTPSDDHEFVDLQRRLELHVDASLEAPAAARAAVRRALLGISERAAQVAVLLVSEVVTNAVLHARSPAIVRCDVGQRVVRIEVQDSAPRAPIPCSATETAGQGRGLKMVSELADRSGWTRYPRGKVVWFELDIANRG